MQLIYKSQFTCINMLFQGSFTMLAMLSPMPLLLLQLRGMSLQAKDSRLTLVMLSVLQREILKHMYVKWNYTFVNTHRSVI